MAPATAPLADVHCFCLANVLRRPLIIYGDAQAAAAALSGVYLPSLWPAPQAQCLRQPLVSLPAQLISRTFASCQERPPRTVLNDALCM